MKKKILVYSLTTTYGKSSASKGQFIHFENKALVDSGFNVKTFIPHSKGTLSKEIIDSVEVLRFRYLPEKFEINSTIPETIRKSRIGFIKVIIMVLGFFVFTFFKSLKEKPDIFLGHWAFPGGYISYHMAKIFRKKFIVAFHGGEVSIIRNSNFLKKIIIPALNNASAIIANSTFTMNEFKKMGVKKEIMIRVTPQPNYVKHISDRKFLEEFRRKFTNPSNKIILFVGRLVELKGTEYLIKSLAKTKNIHLIIVGGGELHNELRKLTESLHLENKVTFFGVANHEELGWLYDISNVFVLPSIVDSTGATEGLGLVLLEAMESGLPVIATNVGGIPEIVENGKNGLLVKQKDPESIAIAIDQILNNEELAKRLVEKSREKVKEFNIQKTLQGYVRVITDVLND